MDTRLIQKLKLMFDDIVHNEEGIDFWYARELMPLLGYKRWENFQNVIDKAIMSCETAKTEVFNHFREVTKMVKAGVSEKPINDYMLTRYACYLIAQNGDPTKEEISFAQSYFAIQTRRQELIEDRIRLNERLNARDKLRTSEKNLSQNIYERGVDDKGFGRIRSKGDAALFGGNSTSEMKTKYGVSENRPLADFLPSVTIAAKNLATEMTNYNVEENDLYGEPSITSEHIQNNTSVRKMLTSRGIVPENLPPAEDIKKLERRVKREEKQLSNSTLPNTTDSDD